MRPRSGEPPWARPFSPEASSEDVYACFRLLLGRNPGAAEWTGHAGAGAGRPLAELVRGYLNSLEFSRRRLFDPPPGDEARIVRAAWPGFDIFCDGADPLIGGAIAAGAYEPEIVALFQRLLRPGMGVVDIGANVGIFSLLAASIVGPSGYVLAMEPNPANARLLERSRRANGFAQIELAQAAAADRTGLLVLHTAYTTGTASAPADADLAAPGTVTIPALRADALVPADRRIDLVKIDTDGGEHPALAGCGKILARDRPVIISEYVPGLMPGVSGVEGETFLRFLADLGYDVAVVRPDGSVEPTGNDWSAVARALAAAGTDHIDLFATPR